MNSIRIGPGEGVVGEDAIRRQVHTFYARVRRHPVLGPIFNEAVEDWDEHLAEVADALLPMQT